MRPSGVHHGLVAVAVQVTPGYRLYADDFKVETPPPAALEQIALPAPAMVFDDLAGAMKPVYTSNFTAVYALTELPGASALLVRVSYLGCDDSICFLPQTREFNLALPAGDFLKFLEIADGSRPAVAEPGESAGENSWWFIILILLGGLALNLTPCVLPMIPVNLAIIGAGAVISGTGAGSRRRGFGLGCLYGLGITAAYGLLGALVVLTGSVFGAVNASPWFNFGIALLFLGMALAMFDIWTIDFSRWQSRLAFSGGGRLAIVLMGAVSAVLAGACASRR